MQGTEGGQRGEGAGVAHMALVCNLIKSLFITVLFRLDWPIFFRNDVISSAMLHV